MRSIRPCLPLCLLFGVLAGGACSSVESATPGGTGGAPHDGGGGGGGQGGERSTCESALWIGACISSCAAATPEYVLPVCDEAVGVKQCPPGYTTQLSCPPGACAWPNILCCDEQSGAVEPPPCKSDGLRDVCPAGSHSSPSSLCIPQGVTSTNCYDLDGTSCASPGQQCRNGLVTCSCGAGDGGTLWSCQIAPSP